MIKNTILFGISLCAFLALTSLTGFAQTKAAPNSIEGRWLGNLDAGGTNLRIVLKITGSADGTFIAKLDSPDQGANDLEIDSISQDRQSMRFEAKKYGISYEGTLNENFDEITGTFKQGGGTLPLVFKRTAGPVSTVRPQDPVKPYPYNEEEVVYENTPDSVKLAGTLTIPRRENGGRDKLFPAVILITGSGAQDRNETTLGHHPFLVLADYLTRHGIAVLRVDDRGVGGSGRGATPGTSENYAGDVSAGIEYLKTRREIDPRKIGLIGHSEGGMIAPLVAARSADVSFIVLLAGPGQTGEEVLYSQTALLEKAAGVAPEITARRVDWTRRIYAVVKAQPDNKLAAAEIRTVLAAEQNALAAEEQKEFLPWRAEIEKQMSVLLSPWFRYFIAYDPRPALVKVHVPVLALNGENDLQIAPQENLRLIAAALEAGGNKHLTVKSFPKLNHLFQTSETGSPGEYGKIDETIAPQVLEVISSWIIQQTN